ncbi:hypothetical protein [Anaerosalibacter bizertensis]|uniref:Uncharacterized protein n=2 Tax=Anaerosalibacter bizertensis TaxID=932217 RepID=A0A9Q4AE81_9FIRM|nr:hypothetical protein [Anaerosalibacter bizertensis]MBV1822177.1 hypothetical protein [Bacteroidales bacterium MSK.15.36]MCG4566026.1 hypothetical protein [Anaerosalibacter bizertensis]HHV26997.1 hypothetical protein [Tissierellia bacterium]
MMKIFKNFLSKEVDLEGVTDEELKIALDQIGRDLVYNYLLFGQDVTMDMFIENLKRYLYLNSHL